MYMDNNARPFVWGVTLDKRVQLLHSHDRPGPISASIMLGILPTPPTCHLTFAVRKCSQQSCSTLALCGPAESHPTRDLHDP